ncbi:MAG TPA: hypothetical protein VJ787_06490, partial [Thermoleophilia bacterium]|nr:hypothetical protein [Thermoleophilia bacterium]
MAEMLVYSERRQTALELLSKGTELATALGVTLTAAALGPGAGAGADALGAAGAERIYVSEDPALEGLQIDVVAQALAQIAKENDATCVLLGSTRGGRELAGRLAQKLDAGCVTDVNGLMLEDGALVASRYALGGATVQREIVDTPIKVFAVMPKTFEAGQGGAGAGEVVTPSLQLLPSFVKVAERRPNEGEAVNLGAAERIVGVGRGFGKR